MDTKQMLEKAMEYNGAKRAKLILLAVCLDVNNELTNAERAEALLNAYNALQFEEDPVNLEI